MAFAIDDRQQACDNMPANADSYLLSIIFHMTTLSGCRLFFYRLSLPAVRSMKFYSMHTLFRYMFSASCFLSSCSTGSSGRPHSG